MMPGANNEVLLIITKSGKIHDMNIHQQKNGTWTATVIFDVNGILKYETITKTKRDSAFRSACEFVRKNIDEFAYVHSL
ncbi:hypothetical protein SAMN05216325_1392 [Nitrosomonas marina]|uniref:Uncharacterized protein n=1 Tax=Nitrosomonas marina TaxID=917 RepID=A0A1H8IR88_9PROT|nr:hypothetical protein SAMN05216325_1392 [Nitrosomonas marina]